MKRFLFLTTAFILFSCSTNEITHDLDNTLSSKEKQDSENLNQNNVVVRFKDGLSEIEKQNIRADYDVVDFEVCSCGDPDLENWFFNDDTDLIDLEEKVLSMESDTEMEGADINFEIAINTTGFTKEHTSVNREIKAGINNISPKGDVIIGVLDSGITPSYFKFTSPFLFDSSNLNDDCGNELFGWNFIDNNNAPIDDIGHGTRVSYFIYEQLTNVQKKFQILPAKVFDASGKSSLFTINCGFSYLIKRKANIINMSFGWTHKPSSVMVSYINDIEDSTLITASAGNTGENNDAIPHFPSSYTNTNILAITTIDNATPPSLVLGNTSLSNFGKESVDIGAKGFSIPYYVNEGMPPIYISGTSYSSAFACGYGAALYEHGKPAIEWSNQIIENTIPSPNLYQIKYAAYLNL